MMSLAAKAFRSIEKYDNFYELPVNVYNLNAKFKELVLEFIDGSALIIYEHSTGRIAVTYCRNKLAKTQRTIYVDDFSNIKTLLCIIGTSLKDRLTQEGR